MTRANSCCSVRICIAFLPISQKVKKNPGNYRFSPNGIIIAWPLMLFKYLKCKRYFYKTAVRLCLSRGLSYISSYGARYVIVRYTDM